jgi:transposase-like protein
MDPQTVFCPNADCPARGQLGKDNIRLHSRKEGRYRCQVCGRTFAARRGTPFYRLRTADETVTRVVTLLAYGCPVAAIVQAFGLDERTVCAWWQRTGQHCLGLHEHLVAAQRLDLQQVQADEIRVKTQAGVYWMALAIMVSTRLWLGGVVSAHRDLDLIEALANQIRQMARCRPLLLAVDGLASYVTAFQQAFRSPLPRLGPGGRPHFVAWPDIAIVQVVKQRVADRLNIDRRIVQGDAKLITRLIQATQGHGGINTAFIERLNATFRQRLSALARRTRALARRPETLTAGMYVVGCLYNFCACHHSLRLKLSVGTYGHHWVPRTPALAAGLTDHVWTIHELLAFHVPPPPWRPPKRRGRWSTATHALVDRWAT